MSMPVVYPCASSSLFIESESSIIFGNTLGFPPQQYATLVPPHVCGNALVRFCEVNGHHRRKDHEEKVSRQRDARLCRMPYVQHNTRVAPPRQRKGARSLG